MVEALVTIVIVAFSLLGFAGLLAKSVKDSRTAYMRSQATFLAYGIVESMRANRGAAIKGDYNVVLHSKMNGLTQAALDVKAWKDDIAQLLPGGDGSVTVLGSDGYTTIVIQWDDDGDGNYTSFTTQTTI